MYISLVGFKGYTVSQLFYLNVNGFNQFAFLLTSCTEEMGVLTWEIGEVSGMRSWNILEVWGKLALFLKV